MKIDPLSAASCGTEAGTIPLPLRAASAATRLARSVTAVSFRLASGFVRHDARYAVVDLGLTRFRFGAVLSFGGFGSLGSLAHDPLVFCSLHGLAFCAALGTGRRNRFASGQAFLHFGVIGLGGRSEFRQKLALGIFRSLAALGKAIVVWMSQSEIPIDGKPVKGWSCLESDPVEGNRTDGSK
jgi:hypothetical protein